MSVYSESDQYYDKAKINLRDCIIELQKVIDTDTNGSKDYNSEFIINIEESITELLKIKRKLST